MKNIRILRDNRCGFCPAVDSIEHFLFECPLVQVFWKDLITWIDREANLQIDISVRAFLFGIPEAVPQARLINFILLFTKFFIYRQKLFYQGSLSLIHFLQEMRQRILVEKYLNTIEKRPHFFNI